MIRLADRPHPAARSGDICMHEFTHAVVHRIARLSDDFASPTARAINEGFADYAQATFFNDPRFGDWVRDEPDGARRCDDKTLRLKANPDDSVQDRYAVGAACVSSHSSTGCTYETARQALHHADLALFPARRSGRHQAEINEVVDGRMA